MSDNDPGKLDPALRALLDGEAKYSDMPADAPAKLFAKVSAGLHLPADGGGGHGSGSAGGSGGVSGQAATTHAVTHTAWSAAKTATLIAFGAGTVVGVVGHATYELVTEPAHVEATASTGAAPVVSPPDPSASVPLTVNSIASTASAWPLPTLIVRTNTPKADSKIDDTGDDQDLAAERTQLEVARTALARGQVDAALATLRSDASKRPKSRLAEERDSLTIQALMMSGHSDEAVAKFSAFRKKYPKSLFLPIVEAAVANAPTPARDQ